MVAKCIKHPPTLNTNKFNFNEVDRPLLIPETRDISSRHPDVDDWLISRKMIKIIRVLRTIVPGFVRTELCSHILIVTDINADNIKKTAIFTA